MTDKKWLVPDVIDPAAKVCVQLEIPNDIKHIAAFWGALEQLGKAYNWEDSYVEGSQTAYVWQDVLEGASEAVKIGVNCMLDCDDVEGCLETSTIINIIEGDIINNETNIENNETNITNIYEGGIDTNVYPPAPTLEEPDLLCGASYRIAQETIDFVEQTVIDVIAITQDAWILALLFLGNWILLRLNIFWDYIVGNEPSLDGVDFDQYLDQLAEAFYCAELDIDEALDILDDTIPEMHRTAMILAFQGITQSQVLLWAFVGGLDDSHDCSSFCVGNDPVIVVPCYGGGAGGTIEFLGGIRWRATATLRFGSNRAVTLGSEDGNCFTLSNIVIVGQGNPGWYGFKECSDFCNAEASHSPTHAAHKEFGWTDNSSVFTVEFDYVAGV